MQKNTVENPTTRIFGTYRRNQNQDLVTALFTGLNMEKEWKNFRNQMTQAQDLPTRRNKATWLRKLETKLVTSWSKSISLERAARSAVRTGVTRTRIWLRVPCSFPC